MKTRAEMVVELEPLSREMDLIIELFRPPTAFEIILNAPLVVCLLLAFLVFESAAGRKMDRAIAGAQGKLVSWIAHLIGAPESDRLPSTQAFIESATSSVKEHTNPANSIVKFLLVTLHLTNSDCIGWDLRSLALL